MLHCLLCSKQNQNNESEVTGMDSRDYIWEFEDFLQDNAEQHKLYPTDKVWAGIQHSLQPKPKWTYLYVTTVFLVLSIAGKLFNSSLIHEPLLVASSSSAVNEVEGKTIDENATKIVRPIAKIIPIRSVEQPQISIEADEVKNIEVATTETFTKNETALEEVIVTPQNAKPLMEEDIAEGTLQLATINRIPGKNRNPFQSFDTKSISEEIKKLPKSNALKIGWQLYVSPNISYRQLKGKGLPYYTSSNLNSVFSTANVENSVTHKPALGFEMGGAITYAVHKAIRLKAGLQFNVNRYEVQAFHSVPEVAPMTSNNSGSGSINVVSTFRNYNGFSKTWLKNQHILMSIPVGVELTVAGNEKIQLKIASTIQPTLVVNNQAYMISTNMKNYAKAPSLYKELNIAAGAEAFISVKGKTLRYTMGPQFRYQLFSSYKKPYPISEYLTDYGLKVSIGR